MEKVSQQYFRGHQPVTLVYSREMRRELPGLVVWKVEWQPYSLEELSRRQTEQPLHVVSHAA